MKKLLIILLILNFTLYAKEELKIISQYKNGKIYLKWIPSIYSSDVVYNLYKITPSKEKKLLAQTKVKSMEEIDKKYDKQSQRFFFPYRNVKTKKEKEKIVLNLEKINAFRMLQATQNNGFANDLGQFFIDEKVSKGKNSYFLEMKIKDKILTNKITVDTAFSNVSSGIFFILANDSMEGVNLSWGIGKDSAFYNIYRRLDKEKSFSRINKKPFLISSNIKDNEKMYTDKNLKEGEKAFYYIRKINAFGWENSPTKTVSAKRLKKEKVPSVEKVFVKAKSDKIAIRWTKVKDALGYNVYRGIDYIAKFKKLNKNPIKDLFYYDKNYIHNKNYYYYVTAINKDRIESRPSTKMLSYSRDALPPMYPKNLRASVKAGEISFTWDKNKEKDLLGYRLFMSMDKNPEIWSMIEKNIIKSNSFIHKRPKSLSANKYYYHVRAVDKHYNESAKSKIIAVQLPDVTPPLQPVIKDYQVYPNEIKFSWNKIVDKSLSHYNIYTQIGDKLIKLNKKPLTSTSFTYKFKNNINSLRKYLITSVDKAKNESSKEKHIIVKYLDIKAPSFKEIKYIQNKNALTINFKVMDKDYNGFEVYESSGKNPKFINISGFKKGNSFIDNELNKNQKYWFKIKIYDKNGNSRFSEVKEILWK